MENGEVKISDEIGEKEPASIGFNWIAGSDKHLYKEGFSLTTSQGDVCAYVAFQELAYQKLDQEIKERLKEYVTTEGEKVYYYVNGGYDVERICHVKPSSKPSLTHKKTSASNYEVPKPQELSVAEAAKIIANRPIAIYTGAGVSVHAGTPDMERLEGHLRIDRNKLGDDFTRELLFDPENLKRRIAELQATFFETTTPAHLVLAKLQEKYGFNIITENLDFLHEGAGTKPIKRGHIDELLTDEELIKIEYIMTIGLRADDSGLLHRYREVNPKGKFIALNIKVPPYMDNSDYYLEGDVQKTLPAILAKIEQL